MAKSKSVDLFGDDQNSRPENEFEALLNSSGVSVRGLAAGDRFRGEVLAVSGSEAFISTGTPTDAILPLSTQGEKPNAGDVLDVIVVRAREGEIMVRLASGRGGSVEADSLQDAFDMEIPVEGMVTESVKGGFKVKIQGVGAFCPISQMDWRCERPEDYVGRKFEFIITRWERGRDLVVSRRKILEQERAVNEGDFQTRHAIGDILSGEIFRLEKYGAFVRLDGGIEGLIPSRELSFSRVAHAQEVVTVGQKVQVKLMSVIEEGDRLKISFSLKDGGGVDDPWASLESVYPVGSVLEGTVEGRENFGLFVRVASGITGLLPKSAWRDSTDAKTIENKRKGEAIKVRIARIDMDTRKISLSLAGSEDEADETWKSHSSAVGAGTKSMGTLGDLLKNVKLK